MSDTIRIAFGGAGKMYSALNQGLCSGEDIQYMGAVGRRFIGIPEYDLDVTLEYGDISLLLRDRGDNIDVFVDVSHYEIAVDNVTAALKADIPCVVGTSGIDPERWKDLHDRNNNVPLLVVPNFSIVSALRESFSRQAAEYLKTAEIREEHHDKKVDAPSGTSVATARALTELGVSSVEIGEENYPGARGAKVGNIRIHSSRKPGRNAHQHDEFSSRGEELTISHDLTDRSAYVPGARLAIQAAHNRGFKFITGGLAEIMGLPM